MADVLYADIPKRGGGVTLFVLNILYCESNGTVRFVCLICVETERFRY